MTEYIGGAYEDQAVSVPTVILASTSPYRRQILTDAGVSVQCVAPGVDESLEAAPDPVSRACALALSKARAVSQRSAIVIGGDQVAHDPTTGEIFGKPTNPSAHGARLRSLRGRTHVLVTGFAVLQGTWHTVGHETTSITMRGDITDEEIERYVATGEGSGCAGGYAAEGLGGFLIARIDGDWFNVIGLPLFRVMTVLRERGWRHGE